MKPYHCFKITIAADINVSPTDIACFHTSDIIWVIEKEWENHHVMDLMATLASLYPDQIIFTSQIANKLSQFMEEEMFFSATEDGLDDDMDPSIDISASMEESAYIFLRMAKHAGEAGLHFCIADKSISAGGIREILRKISKDRKG